MDDKLPERKHTRLKNHDYSLAGKYYVTVCAQDRKNIFSHIVGRGLAPAGMVLMRGEASVGIILTRIGIIVENEIKALENKYDYVTVDKYVIMPNHIHMILCFDKETAGASPRPTLMDLMCEFKSVTTKKCKEIRSIEKVFQNSFYEHIIRNHDDYKEVSKYIRENPERWLRDKLYSDL